MGRCDDPDCNGVTDFDESAQAIVCTSCGKVINQSILRDDWDGETAGSSFYFGPTALKSLRRAGASLSGQYDKEERDSRNMHAMHQYIGTILTRLANPGLTERACTLFTQVRARQYFKWGKKAVLVAGVCIAIVLRENKKGVLLKDLSTMLDISPTALFRNITQVSKILDISLPPLDPLALISRIQTYVTELASTPDTPLPKNLCTFIKKVSAPQVVRLSSALVALISQVEELPLVSSPLPMTCAIFLIALEGQAAESIPSHPLLAKELASRVGVRKDLVMTQYNTILDVLASWMADVPWLSSSNDPDNIRSKRRKTSHRHVVAMGIKEVVRFRVEALKHREHRDFDDFFPVLSLEIPEHEVLDEDQIGQKRRRAELSSRQLRSMRLVRAPPKQIPLTQVDIASLSLLSPSHPLAPEYTIKRASKQDGLAKTIMTSSIFPADQKYSRLQLLVSERGGEAFIQDNELFDLNEFEETFRSEEEVTKLRAVFAWEEETSVSDSDPGLLSESSNILHECSSNELGVWLELGDAAQNEVDNGVAGEQIIGDWREVSPIDGLQLDEDDFDFQSDW
ncbi:hypothetical protein Clacol_007605 [Clathrus columnatus]|uniref:Uncharacterized protein n=1 Tax=Clathrus columnatus TaxID=1419009 RepID=A0AAV5AIL5_9AGAM|nr:hypothetical protein Clacol_007605 [Clathrus columnatus]